MVKTNSAVLLLPIIIIICWHEWCKKMRVSRYRLPEDRSILGAGGTGEKTVTTGLMLPKTMA